MLDIREVRWYYIQGRNDHAEDSRCKAYQYACVKHEMLPAEEKRVFVGLDPSPAYGEGFYMI